MSDLIGAILESCCLTLVFLYCVDIVAPCCSAKPLFQPHGYSLQLVALWSASKSLGSHATHAELNAGK